MNQLNVGDVVYLNSEDDVKMTVVAVDDTEIQCAYFNKVEAKFVLTMTLPKEAVRQKKPRNDDYYQ